MDSDSASSEITVDSPLLRIYKDGHIERLMGTEVVPPGLDQQTNVDSKDILSSSPQTRLYIPKNTAPAEKLPVLIYFHGGNFCVETAFSPTYHNYLNSLVAEAKIIAVSVDYRRAPEHPIPTPYDDSWAAIKWVAAHSEGAGSEELLNNHADFGKVFLCGDNCGANIAHHMGMKLGTEKIPGLTVNGIVLIQPFFWGIEPIGDEPESEDVRAIVEGMWKLAAPESSGCDDPWINPIKGPRLTGIGCGRMLVAVALGDILKSRGWLYYEEVKKSGWGGEIEIMEAEGESHVFHLFNPSNENAVAMLKRVASFFKQD